MASIRRGFGRAALIAVVAMSVVYLGCENDEDLGALGFELPDTGTYVPPGYDATFDARTDDPNAADATGGSDAAVGDSGIVDGGLDSSTDAHSDSGSDGGIDGSGGPDAAVNLDAALGLDAFTAITDAAINL